MARMNHGAFEHRLLAHPEAFTEAYAPRRVNNVYFDTFGLSAYEDILGGSSAKKKYRVRWYGPHDPRGEITGAALEIKVKSGALNGKISYPLPSLRYADILVPRTFLDLVAGAGLAPRHFETLACMQPVLVNSYRRRYHLSQDRRFRFTSDFDLSSARPAFPEHIASSRVRPLDEVIVEFKYARQDDEAAQSILQAFPLRVQTCSKFAMGMQMCRL
jgi:SPX domain protein involved in polyphosphate accumulation